MAGEGGSTSVEAVLTDLAARAATGCLSVRDEQGAQAELYLRDGQVYAVTVPGRRPRLGARLTTSGALDPARLAEALEVQRTELQGWRLGELLVHLGHVDRAVVEAYVVEQLEDAVTDLLGWPVVAWRFRPNRRTRQDVAPPSDVAELLAHARSRRVEWATVVAETGGALGVPELVDRDDPFTSPDDPLDGADRSRAPLDPAQWALLSRVDGRRTLGMLATACGLTLFEAGQVVRHLLAQGLVTVRRPVVVPDDPEPSAAPAPAVAPAAAAAPPLAPAPALPAGPLPARPGSPAAVEDDEARRRREAEEIASLLQARAEADAAARRARRLARHADTAAPGPTAPAEPDEPAVTDEQVQSQPVAPVAPDVAVAGLPAEAEGEGQGADAAAAEPAGAPPLEPDPAPEGELEPEPAPEQPQPDPEQSDREQREAAERERQLALQVLAAVPRMRPPVEPAADAADVMTAATSVDESLASESMAAVPEAAASVATVPLVADLTDSGLGAGDLGAPPAEPTEPSEPTDSWTFPQAPRTPVPVTDGYAPSIGLADTAALLRELTNLGVDESDRPRLPSPTARPTATAPLPERRRRRLFGH